jgi:cytochrome c-type biogenesis protein CcmF
MIVELGHFALVLALFVSLAQAVLPLWGAARRHPGMMAVAPAAALAAFVLVAMAFAALINAYVTSDFSVLNVVENSHTDKPLLYKITGV